MAKSKKKTIGAIQRLLPFVACVLGVVAVVMLFLPAIAIKDSETTYTGWQTVFGYTKETALGNVNLLKFSVPLFICVLLTVAGAACALLQVFLPNARLFTFLSVLCLLVAAILWFLQVPLVALGDGFTLGGWLNDGNLKEGLALGVGAIVGGILTALACIAEVATIVLDK